MCGDYYIGGRQFDSLSDLIGYYTSWSDLLKKERLVYPVPPPEVMFICILKYSDILKLNFICFKNAVLQNIKIF